MKNHLSLFTRAISILFLLLIIRAGDLNAAPKPAPLPPSTGITSSLGVSFAGTLSGNESNDWVTIGDLASVNDSNSDQQITTTSSGRIMISGHIEITDTANSYDIQGACRLRISDGTGPSNGLTVIGRGPEWHTVTPSTSNLVFTIPIIAFAVKPAGTYNVQAQCFQTFGGPQGSITAVLDDMVVWEGQ